MSSTTENVKQSLGVCTKCFRTFEDQERSLKKDGIHYNRTCKRCLLYVKNWDKEKYAAEVEERKEMKEMRQYFSSGNYDPDDRFICGCGSDIDPDGRHKHYKSLKHRTYVSILVPEIEAVIEPVIEPFIDSFLNEPAKAEMHCFMHYITLEQPEGLPASLKTKHEEFLNKIKTYNNGCIEYLGIPSLNERIKVSNLTSVFTRGKADEFDKLNGLERLSECYLFNQRDLNHKFMIRYTARNDI